MPSASVTKREHEIDEYISMLEKWWRNQEDSSQAAAQKIGAEYIIVVAYGLVESEMQKMLKDYSAVNNSNRFIIHAMNQSIDRIHSWSFKKIKEVLSMYSTRWSERAGKLENQQITAINELNKVRNCIAHGYSYNVSFEDAVSHFKSAVQGLHAIHDIIYGDSS